MAGFKGQDAVTLVPAQNDKASQGLQYLAGIIAIRHCASMASQSEVHHEQYHRYETPTDAEAELRYGSVQLGRS